MQFVPPVVVQPPSLLFLAKIVPSIAVIVSRLNVLHVPHAAMTPTAIVVVAIVAEAVVAMVVVAVIMVVVAVAETETAVMVVVVTAATAAGKKRQCSRPEGNPYCGLPSCFILRRFLP
jgi:hypothetical protein